jgi:hypothetical protein
MVDGTGFRCSNCGEELPTKRALYLHEQNTHVRYGRAVPERGPRQPRKRFSVASLDGSCPRCSGVGFTAKRSKKGKAVGALFGGLGILAAPKTQVRCNTCGTMFKRS